MRRFILLCTLPLLATGLSAEADERPYFGILAGSEEDQEQEGAPVGVVLPKSPAAEAGVKRDDVITAINRIPVKDFTTLHTRLGKFETGDEIVLTVHREGKTLSLKAVLGDLPPAYPVVIKDGRPPRVPGGTLIVRGGGTSTIDGGLNTGGNTIINGSILVVRKEFRQTWYGLLDFEITGVPNTSLIKVKGKIVLGGNLYVHAAKSVKLKVGDSFQVVSGGTSLEGEFGRLLLPELNEGLKWKIHYDDVQKGRDFNKDGAHDVTLEVVKK